jgi:hypothetical protein
MEILKLIRDCRSTQFTELRVNLTELWIMCIIFEEPPQLQDISEQPSIEGYWREKNYGHTTLSGGCCSSSCEGSH